MQWGENSVILIVYYVVLLCYMKLCYSKTQYFNLFWFELLIMIIIIIKVKKWIKQKKTKGVRAFTWSLIFDPLLYSMSPSHPKPHHPKNPKTLILSTLDKGGREWASELRWPVSDGDDEGVVAAIRASETMKPHTCRRRRRKRNQPHHGRRLDSRATPVITSERRCGTRRLNRSHLHKKFTVLLWPRKPVLSCKGEVHGSRSNLYSSPARGRLKPAITMQRKMRTKQ